MPLVERVCACGHRWDDLVGVVQEAARTDCPLCGARSRRTAPGGFGLTVCGTERMSAVDLASAHENKRWIEGRADEVRSGAVRLKTKSSVPLELRPDLPRLFH